MGHIPVNVDLAQVAFEVVDAVVGQLGLGAVLPDGQGLGSPVILLVQNGIQTAGQLAVQVALENGFLRVGRSAVVNMKYIRQISSYMVTLRNGVKLGVSRNGYAEIRNTYLEWKGQSRSRLRI